MNDLDWMTVNWFLVVGAINFYEGLVFARTCAYRRLCPFSLPRGVLIPSEQPFGVCVGRGDRHGLTSHSDDVPLTLVLMA